MQIQTATVTVSRKATGVRAHRWRFGTVPLSKSSTRGTENSDGAKRSENPKVKQKNQATHPGSLLGRAGVALGDALGSEPGREGSALGDAPFSAREAPRCRAQCQRRKFGTAKKSAGASTAEPETSWGCIGDAPVHRYRREPAVF
jgi:hypothetical protein